MAAEAGSLLPRITLCTDGIPAALKRLRQWVGFALLPPRTPGEKPRKVPKDPRTGRNASTTNARTWGSFSEASSAVARFGLAGVGFVFTDSGFTGVDFDYCRDAETGVIEHGVLSQVRELASYTEISPTGTGIHVIVRGNLPGKGIKVGKVEVYDNGRFFTVTGKRVPDTPAEIADRSAQISKFYENLEASRSTARLNSPRAKSRDSGSGPTQHDAVVHMKLLEDALDRSKKLRALWHGDHTAYLSQSDADLALCSLLRRICSNDPVQMDSMFRRSGLMRKKWDERRGEKTYGQRTIEKSCASSSSRRYKPDSASSEIIVTPGKLHSNTDQAEELILATQPPRVFQRDRLLVQLVRTQALTTREGTRRPQGAVVLVPVDADYLVELLTTLSAWKKSSRDKLVSIDAPLKIARTLMSRVGRWKVPHLVAVIETPTIRPDGSVLSVPGYDEQTGLYFDAGHTQFPAIKDVPTRKDAFDALAKFEPVLRDFPWRESADRSAALAGLLTPLVRRTLRSAPLFAFRAPKMSSGKSLLVDCASYMATGRVCAVMTQGKDDDEHQKRMLAVLAEGDSVNSIDNIERPLGGADLCVILTQETYQGRLLGMSRMIRVPTCTTWFATGNNLALEGDLCSRAVLCDLNPGCEHPQQREFEINLREYVPENRGELVIAGLTMMLAYIRAGSPNVGLKPFGRFETWSDLVRATIVWLGQPDPLATLHRLEDIDPVRRQLREILQAWKHMFRGRTVTAAQVISTLNGGSEAGLPVLLADATRGEPGRLSAQSLGQYLRKFERRIEAGLFFERVGESSGVARWRVVEVSGGPGGPRGETGATRERDTETKNDVSSGRHGKVPQAPQVPSDASLKRHSLRKPTKCEARPDAAVNAAETETGGRP